jgi:hypothetical protein
MRNRRLTLQAAPANRRAMKNLLLIVAASAALVACEKETIDQGGKEREVAAANAAKVVLPPSISAMKTYRCKDNSLVHIDWLSDKLSANYRADQGGAPVQLKAAAAGEPMIAEGYSLTGDAKAATITIARPGIAAQSCKA